MELFAEIKDRKGDTAVIRSYQPVFREAVMELFREGYPSSFDDNDMDAIEEGLEGIEESNSEMFLAFENDTLVAARSFQKVRGPQDFWEGEYLYSKGSCRGRGLGVIMVATTEEYVKDKARVWCTMNAGILPEGATPYQFFMKLGFQQWSILPGYFRDDLPAILIVKRNPYYDVDRGIPDNMKWHPGLVYTSTGIAVSRKEYQDILHALKPVPKEKWGLGLIGRENVINWKVH